MTSLEIFRIVATEFSTSQDSVVNSWIKLTEPLISKKIFGKFYEQAVALLTAHRMKLAGLSPADGETGSIADAMKLASYSEGGVSISYGVNQGNNLAVDAELTLTIYGIQYLNLRRLVIIPIRSAGE